MEGQIAVAMALARCDIEYLRRSVSRLVHNRSKYEYYKYKIWRLALFSITILSFAAAVSAASASGAADPNNPGYLIIASTEPVLQKNYPKESLERGEQGIVKFRIETRASGDLGVCQVVGSSGYARLDMATCDLLIGKAAFKKVVKDGSRVKGERFGQVNWILPEGHPAPAVTPAKSSPADIARAGEAFMCRYSEKTGSLVKKTKQCMRGGDFDSMSKMMQAELDRLRMNTWQSSN